VRTRFPALAFVAYRRYLIGQGVSQAGTWMQNVAQALLVLQLTGRGTDLGLIVGAQYLPMLVLSPLAGAVLDRVDLRRVLLATQLASLCLALGLGVVTATGSARLWTVFCFALGLGLTQVVDTPARQTFMYELVVREALPSGIALSNVSSNAARIFGPTLATFSASLLGLAPCFFLNSVTYLFLFAILWRIRLSGDAALGDRAAQLAPFTAGLRYVCSRRELWTALMLALMIGLFAWEFQVTLPLLAAFAFHNEAAYGTMTTVMAVGAVFGGLLSATSRGGSGRRVALLTAAFGVSIAAAACAPNLATALIALVPVGALGTSVVAQGNTYLQLTSDASMRGSVVTFWTAAILGTAPIGAPLAGVIADDFGARWALAGGGIATVLGALAVAPALPGARARDVSWRRLRPEPAEAG
jgi:MFS family permease